MATTETFLDKRIAATEKAIEAVEAAITSVSSGAQQYTLDTGQTRQTVTKSSLGSLRLQLDQLDNRYTTLCARRDGASFVGRMAGSSSIRRF